MTYSPYRIVRPGLITPEDLKKVVPNIVIASPKTGRAVSPGIKHRHYVPYCKVIVIKSAQWDKTLQKWKHKKIPLGVLALTQTIPDWTNIVFKKTLRKPRQYAAQLYANFFEAEKAKVQVLLVESMKTQGAGLAVMDRLSRASA
jgi:L-threonylcarbamoyladenylate synthase